MIVEKIPKKDIGIQAFITYRPLSAFVTKVAFILHPTVFADYFFHEINVVIPAGIRNLAGGGFVCDQLFYQLQEAITAWA